MTIIGVISLILPLPFLQFLVIRILMLTHEVHAKIAGALQRSSVYSLCQALLQAFLSSIARCSLETMMDDGKKRNFFSCGL